ncbi:RagB/SusD family nutrient uptake outer membrane protein [Pedobacter nyackensis]|uniref:Starch-binding associating with outer membrane n=1 Tax=Pedobacter nyackensis TaxID=475255 RepID=A0A1W2EUU1_9SPHI|nr:RagB/SusD family nutrient uptake outer membrane protein [Pedobacter nyackensis]SMD13477.1 Starch-binding associating with outer membrane [Pedobacter nyackensis]
MKNYRLLIIIGFLSISTSCQKYLDVVPDNVPTIDYAFTLRSSAQRFLATCYSYMPRNGHFNTNAAFNAADEVWQPVPLADVNGDIVNIARGLQNVSDPLANYWEGTRQGRPLFQGIRDCNIFLDNIHKVSDLEQYERQRWIAEVKFLKAYYHFVLLRSYGPIPIGRENIPLGSSTDEVHVYREPVDEVVKYIVELLNESAAITDLPDRLQGTESSELGRVTRAMVLALKAKVLVTAASPLFNGNTDYASFKDKKGRQLISSVYNPVKWDSAVVACKNAVELCERIGYGLQHFAGNSGYKIGENDSILTQLDLRTALTDKVNNIENIWVNTQSRATDMQRWSMPLITSGVSGSGPKGCLAPTIKFVEMFYSANGVPIEEDKDYPYAQRYSLQTSEEADKYHVLKGESTVKMHFGREERFYAYLGFDRGIWFGNWVNNYDISNLFAVKTRKGEMAARQGITNYSITSYTIKKLVNIETVADADGNVTGSNQEQYPWPEFRMADLYLLYSEALNEQGSGYNPLITEWINKVRARAGLATVEVAWTNHSSNPDKYKTKAGLREIIQRERTLELAFEGHRYWDLRRWKTAHIELNKPIKGWDISQSDAVSFYREVLLYNQRFTARDYLNPISVNEMQINKNLVQNPGW